MYDVEDDPDTKRVISFPIDGALDLDQVRQQVRTFLADVDEHIVADAVLATVMLAGDACRYGVPPVTLRLRRGIEDPCLRVEVDQRDRAKDPPEDSRAGILNRITRAKGVDRHPAGMTTWAEIALAWPTRSSRIL